MSEPPLASSGPKARQYGGTTVSGEVFAAIQNYVGQGYSAGRIQRELAGTPLATRRQAILDIRREVLAAKDGATGIANTAYSFKPSEGLFQTTARDLKANYQVWAHIDLPTNEPGVLARYGAVVKFDQLLTRTEINNLVLQTLQNAITEYKLKVASEQIRYGYAYRHVDF